MHEHYFGPLRREGFCRSCRKGNGEAIFVDRIYYNTYESLGLGVLARCPVALLPLEDRPEYDMTKYLPPALPLNEVLKHLECSP